MTRRQSRPLLPQPAGRPRRGRQQPAVLDRVLVLAADLDDLPDARRTRRWTCCVVRYVRSVEMRAVADRLAEPADRVAAAGVVAEAPPGGGDERVAQVQARAELEAPPAAVGRHRRRAAAERARQAGRQRRAAGERARRRQRQLGRTAAAVERQREARPRAPRSRPARRARPSAPPSPSRRRSPPSVTSPVRSVAAPADHRAAEPPQRRSRDRVADADRGQSAHAALVEDLARGDRRIVAGADRAHERGGLARVARDDRPGPRRAPPCAPSARLVGDPDRCGPAPSRSRARPTPTSTPSAPLRATVRRTVPSDICSRST